MTDTFSAFSYFVNFLVLLIVALPVYYLLPSISLRRIWLIVISAALMFYVAPKLLLLYLVFWPLGYALVVLLRKQSEKSDGSLYLGAAVVAALLPLVLWKLFSHEFEAQLNQLSRGFLLHVFEPFAQTDAVKSAVIPVGLSFATFRLIDVMVQTHLGLVQKISFLRFMYFGFFPSLLPVGPIAEYREAGAENDQCVAASAENFGAGAMRILIGCAKIFVLAYPLAWSTNIFEYHDFNTAVMMWVSLAAFAIYFWLNFSGYSDIAIGTARLLGVQLKENFNNPYWRRNPQEFWANWHMSLTRFAQRNIFVPLGGFRKKTQFIAIFCTIMTIALWHDISVSLILFGLYHAAGLIFVRIWQDRRSGSAASVSPASDDESLALGARAKDIGSRVATFVFVLLSFPMLVLPYHELPAFYLRLLSPF